MNFVLCPVEMASSIPFMLGKSIFKKTNRGKNVRFQSFLLFEVRKMCIIADRFAWQIGCFLSVFSLSIRIRSSPIYRRLGNWMRDDRNALSRIEICRRRLLSFCEHNRSWTRSCLHCLLNIESRMFTFLASFLFIPDAGKYDRTNRQTGEIHD